MSESADASLALKEECERQVENCTYTALSFTIWLRCLRWVRVGALTAPVIFGALATWQIVAHGTPTLAAVLSFLAIVIPPSYQASKTEDDIKQFTLLAGEFTNLKDRFRQAALISSLKSYDAFDAEAKPYFERLEKARSSVLAPPEWCFKRAREKIKAGHYVHDRDQQQAA